jgi:peptidoglycan/xylan/chitin deacetylase (PgdA/CDA1 family)
MCLRESRFSLGPRRVLVLALAALLAGCGLPGGGRGDLLPTERIAIPAAAVTPLAPTAELPATPTATDSPAPTESPTATATEPPTATPTASATASATPEPLPTPDEAAASRQVRLPILMYHYVEPWPEGANVLRQGLTVTPESFAAQMAYLHANGYVTVSLYDLVYALTLGQPLPERAVVLTFDDGYRSLMDHAVPLLEPYGYTATVFVVTQLMDEGFAQYLTWPQAESLYAQGWKIEPHTKTHDQLEGRDRDFQLYQMLGSQQTVAAHIGATPRFFAYPSGKYDELSIQIAREMHLWGAVTVDFGRVHTLSSLFTLRRVRVSGTASLDEFVNALEGDLQQ